jgi:hypothetical protein
MLLGFHEHSINETHSHVIWRLVSQAMVDLSVKQELLTVSSTTIEGKEKIATTVELVKVRDAE